MLIRPAFVYTFAATAALCILGGCAKRNADGAGHEISDAEVIALSDKLSAAYRAQDVRGLRTLLAPDYTGSAPGILLDITGLMNEFPKIQLRDISRDAYFVRRLAPGAVLLTEDVTLSETYDGEDISGRYRMNTVWVDRAGQWQLLFEQEMPLPQADGAAGKTGQ